MDLTLIAQLSCLLKCQQWLKTDCTECIIGSSRPKTTGEAIILLGQIRRSAMGRTRNARAVWTMLKGVTEIEKDWTVAQPNANPNDWEPYMPKCFGDSLSKWANRTFAVSWREVWNWANGVELEEVRSKDCRVRPVQRIQTPRSGHQAPRPLKSPFLLDRSFPRPCTFQGQSRTA